MNERERRAIERIDECLAWHDLDRPQWVDRLLDNRLILMEEPLIENEGTHTA